MQDKKTIYIADEDREHNHKILVQLRPHGFDVHIFQYLNQLNDAVLEKAPNAIICNTHFSAGDKTGIYLIQRLQKQMQNTVPILFISEHDDPEVRLSALRAGGRAYFVKPINFASMVVKLNELIGKDDHSPYRILMVDDDRSGNILHSAVLKKSGCQVVSITQPLQAIEAALKLKPDLIFLDLYMPELDGLELAALLKQEDSLFETPIVFLSGEEDEEIKLKAIREGAASFLTKPVSPSHLIGVAQTRSYQYRSRQSRYYYQTQINSVTGFIVRDRFFKQLTELKQKQDPSRLFALIMIVIDDYPLLFRSLGEENMRLLFAHIAFLIQSVIKERDIACRYTEHSFLIAVSRTKISRLKHLVELIHQKLRHSANELFQSYKITTSIGVSKLKDSINQALSEASLSCELAQAEGGDQIQYHTDLQREEANAKQIKNLALQIKDAITHQRLILAYSPVIGSNVQDRERQTVMMRLKTKDGKVIYPAEFIVVAHKYKVMPALDRYAIAAAVQSLHYKQKQGQSIDYFIKLSLASVQDQEFIHWLKRLLSRYPIEKNSLIFEISENDVSVNLDLIENFQKAIISLGCQLSIERFGRTKESIKLLDLLPVPYIRLDAHLLENIAKNHNKQIKLRQFCESIHKKEVIILSGYIQDISALALLWSLGVDYIQGDILDETTEMKMT